MELTAESWIEELELEEGEGEEAQSNATYFGLRGAEACTAGRLNGGLNDGGMSGVANEVGGTNDGSGGAKVVGGGADEANIGRKVGPTGGGGSFLCFLGTMNTSVTRSR